MDLVLGQSPAVAAAASAADAAASATASANSAAAAAASAASVSTPGDTVILDGGQLEVAMPSRSITANGSISLSDRGFLINATNAITITLPLGTSVPNGFFVAVKNGNSSASGLTVTIQASGADNIDSNSSLQLSPILSAIIVFVTGVGWRALGRVFINSNTISNSVLTKMPANTIKGNNTGVTADPLDLTVAQVKTLLNLAGTNNGDQTITLTGDVTGSGTGSFAATTASNAVTNAKLADMAASTLKGNNTGVTGDPLDLTATQVTAMLNPMVGDAGAGGTKGLVPAPAAGDASKFLQGNGTWATSTTPFATTAETQAGSLATKAVTPAGLKGAFGLSKFFESAELTFTTSSSISAAHGLGALPKLVLLILRCKTANIGYAVGDEAIYSSSFSSGTSGISTAADTTNIVAVFPSVAPTMLNKTTFASANITTANWVAVFRAWV